MPALHVVDPLPGRAVARRAALALAVLWIGLGCSTDHGLLLDVTGEFAFTRLRVEVKGPDDRPFFWEEFDVPADPTRDLRVDPYRLAIKLPGGGRYGVHIIDVSAGPPSQTWAGAFDVGGVEEGTARLRPFAPGSDEDGDGWSDSCWPGAPPEDCLLIDCDDGDPGVNPFASDVCGDEIDQDCDGTPRACEDRDGDGWDESEDCDDDDEDVHPREPGFCEGVEPWCGNGKDEDCDGRDPACGTDQDCDGWEECDPPGAAGCDCDDADPAVNPEAIEICLDDLDTNCDGDPDDGCDRCDEDGDGWYGEHPERGCSVDPGSRDCDDSDRAIHPGSTDDCGGLEGSPLCAARGYCGLDRADEDCDGMQNEGCPTLGCDQDGDGFAIAACGPAPAMTDCDDTNAMIYPGAPDRCGDGILQNCSIDLACTNDADLDGYNDGPDCDDGNGSVHPGAVDVCDAIDNDCDGVVDEGNPSLTGESLDGAGCNDDNDGACAPTTGRCVCSPTVPDGVRQPGNRVTCPGEVPDTAAVGPRCFGAPQPTDETCNAADDDCDASTDESLMRACSTICGDGVETCLVGVWNCDAPLPTAEICDGLDNDCDGTADDGLGLGTPCDGSDGDQCDEGQIVCDGTGGVRCNDMTGTTTESCDGDDNDCDGQTDEGFNVGADCDGGDSDLCDEGQLICNATGTGTVCDDMTGNNAELCNLIDDDCDGQTDEGFALGLDCDGADADLCEEGVTVCNMAGDGTTCNDTTGNTAEICDYADNDCDGSIDEGFTLGGDCDGADTDLCEEGTVICNVTGSGTTCSDNTGNTTELCNSMDDDCDGTTDEAPNDCSTGQRCSDGSCICDSMSCTGCCNGTTCAMGNTMTNCGTGGEVCSNCNDVLADRCTAGDCMCGMSAPCDPTIASECSTTGCKCYGNAPCNGGRVCCAQTMTCENSCPP